MSIDNWPVQSSDPITEPEEHFIPGEPESDIDDLPGHVFEAEQVLDLYGLFEPICNWDTEHLRKLAAALEAELRTRTDGE